jgi:O-antigen/teichoic acid export membrane protein
MNVTGSSPEPSTFDRAAAAGRSNSIMAPFLLLTSTVGLVVVARTLTTAEFAFYATVIALRSLMGFFGDLGMGAAASRTFAQLQARGAGPQARRLFARLVLVRFPVLAIVAITFLAVPGAIASALHLSASERELLPLLAAIAALEVLGPLGSYALVGTFRHSELNKVVLGAGIVQVVGVIAASTLGAGLAGVVVAVLLASMVRSGAFVALGLRAIRSIASSGTPIDGLAGTYIRVAGASIVAKLAAVVHQRQALTVLGLSVFGRAELAAFALAYDVAQQALTAIAAPIVSLLTPSMSAVASDRAVTEQAYRFLTRLLAIAVLPLGITLAAVSPTLIPAVFGDGFHHAELYALILLPAFAVEIVLLAPPTALMLADNTLLAAFRRIKSWTIAAAILYVPAIALSLTTAVAVMVAVRLLSAAAMHVAVHRTTGLSAFGPWLAPVLAVAAAAAATAAPLAVWLPHTLTALAGELVCALVAATLVARLTGLVEERDLQLAGRAMPSVVRPLRLILRSGQGRMA